MTWAKHGSHAIITDGGCRYDRIYGIYQIKSGFLIGKDLSSPTDLLKLPQISNVHHGCVCMFIDGVCLCGAQERGRTLI